MLLIYDKDRYINMIELDYLFKIDKLWFKTKKWWNKIILNDNIFPEQIKKVTTEEKNIFKIKFLYFIKKLFDINDINDKKKINIKLYNIELLINNFILHIDSFKLLIEDDLKLKNIFIYFFNYSQYFILIKNKFINIIKPLFSEIYSDLLFRCDNDLTRLFVPIISPIVYIYITNRDIEKTLNLYLELDIISVQFFVVSYLIIDNFMDDNTYYIENKIIFFKWFMNIINNPEKEVTLNEEENKIWQCIIFKKYFCKFVEKYSVKDNIILYNFVKLMIQTLNKTNNLQKQNNITDDIILECTFKKSYVVSIFLIIIFNNHINYNLKKTDIKLLCKFFMILQLFDDLVDIDKDKLENNNTYFNFNNFNNFNDINTKIKKVISSVFVFMDTFNDKNIFINNFIYIFTKYTVLYVLFNNTNKLNDDLIKYFLSYSLLDLDILNYIDIKSYNQYNDKLILNVLKKYILN
jgi:hypothetical protein